MERQHTITNDYVSLSDRDTEDKTQAFILFAAIESVVVSEAS